MRLPWKSSTSVDRSLEDESDVDAVIARNLWKHHRLLPPQSTFKHYWDLIMILFVFYSSVFIPMELAFMNSNPAITKHIAHRIFDYGVDIYFLIDIVVNFNTSFYDEDYQIVLERKKIAKRLKVLDAFRESEVNNPEFMILEVVPVQSQEWVRCP